MSLCFYRREQADCCGQGRTPSSELGSLNGDLGCSSQMVSEPGKTASARLYVHYSKAVFSDDPLQDLDGFSDLVVSASGESNLQYRHGTSQCRLAENGIQLLLISLRTLRNTATTSAFP